MSGGRRGPRPYYPNQKFRHHDAGYNFSSDVDMGSANGSFYYGTPRPMRPSYNRGPQHHGGYSQQHRGVPQYRGGGGYGLQYRGGGSGYGGYPGGYEQRGRGMYRPPQRFMGRYPRRPGGYGPHYPQRLNKPKKADDESEDPYYNNFMFEDPWKYMIPNDELGEEGDYMESEQAGEGSGMTMENRIGGEGAENTVVGGDISVEGGKVEGGGEEVKNEGESVSTNGGHDSAGVQEDGGLIKVENEVMEDAHVQEQSTTGE